jgi:hypothetical protein
VDGDFAYIANSDSLVILHLFENTLARFNTVDSVAQSAPIDSTSDLIFEATVTQTAYSPPGTILSWELSANHGADWESVTPGVPHTFLHLGNALLFRVTFSTLHPFLSAYVYNITIGYSYTAPPTAPTLNDPGAIHNLPAITVNWTAATDSDGTVAEYELQMSDSASFSTILNTWTPTTTSQTVSGLINGDYYFRVRAIDDDGVAGPWSNTEDLTITLITPPLPPIPGFPIEAIAMGAIIALSLGIIYRRRKYRK